MRCDSSTAGFAARKATASTPELPPRLPRKGRLQVIVTDGGPEPSRTKTGGGAPPGNGGKGLERDSSPRTTLAVRPPLPASVRSLLKTETTPGSKTSSGIGATMASVALSATKPRAKKRAATAPSCFAAPFDLPCGKSVLAEPGPNACKGCRKEVRYRSSCNSRTAAVSSASFSSSSTLCTSRSTASAPNRTLSSRSLPARA
mmetsp:Transcript_502/g.1587  ORF Transcript_502/g.1587 Transcript_502/m.1587 type:complete len:202 (-) Transcript_502:531-1136(-)